MLNVQDHQLHPFVQPFNIQKQTIKSWDYRSIAVESPFLFWNSLQE